MRTLARLALRCYPPSFRARYGDELAALVDDVGGGGRATADLFLSAARAWLRPSFTGPDARRRRGQATLATTWVAWCLGGLVAPVANRALLDPPTPGASGSVRGLLDAANFFLAVGWGAALLGAAVMVARALVPSLRRGARPLLRPLVPALLLAGAEAAGAIAFAARHAADPAWARHPSDLAYAGLLVWLVGLAALVAAAAIGPVVTLERLAPSSTVLRLPVALTGPVAAALCGAAGCATAAVLTAGDAAILGNGVLAYLVAAAGCGAAVTAVVSSVRGARSLRAG